MNRHRILTTLIVTAIDLLPPRGSLPAGRAFFRRGLILPLFCAGLLLLAACNLFTGPSPPPSPQTPLAGTASSPTGTPEPTPIPRVLTICLGAEPEQLYLYGGQSLSKSHILEAIYDGPIDARGFDYQPVILEKLPSLADGDAVVEPVSVAEEDWVVNDAGQLVQLFPGETVRPFGCTSPDCALVWEGQPLEMAQLSAEFTLLAGLKWSDGEPLTARDSLFSYTIARECTSPAGQCGGYGLVEYRQETVDRTAAYTPLDERSLRWTGVPGFLDPAYRTNFFIPLPEHKLGPYPHEELFAAEQSARLPLGWGPYQIETWQQGDSLRLRANPHYFRASEGLPRFDLLVFRFVGQDSAANLSALASGECDLLDQEASLPLLHEEIATTLDLAEKGQISALFVPGPIWEHLDFGIQHIDYDDGYHPGIDRPDFFGDVRTRQAIAHCLDRQKVVDGVLFGKSAVPHTYLPPDHPLFNPQAARYDFDPQAGMALLEQAGWIDADGDPDTARLSRGIPGIADGTPLAFTYKTTQADQRQQVARLLAESLAACGIQVELEFIPAAALFQEGPEGPVFGRRFDLTQLAWLTGSRPPCDLYTSANVPGPPQGVWSPLGLFEELTFPFAWGGQNHTGYFNPEYDRACRAALEALPGQPGYEEHHFKAQEIFAAELPVVPLYLRPKLVVSHPDLTGLQIDPSAFSEMWNIEAFDRR